MDFSYKQTCLTVGADDANYIFNMVYVGTCGENHDSTVFAKNVFGRSFKTGSSFKSAWRLGLARKNVPIHYFMVADKAFCLKNNIMTPFPGKNVGTIKRLFN